MSDDKQQLLDIPLPDGDSKLKSTKITSAGVENAKKKLRAFSIQKKISTIPQPKFSSPKPSSSTNTVVIGKVAGGKAKISMVQKITYDEVKPKPKQKSQSDIKTELSEIEKMRATYRQVQNISKENLEAEQFKMDCLLFGVPLGLIETTTCKKILPTKSMPPTRLLKRSEVEEFLEYARRERDNGNIVKFDVNCFIANANPFENKKKTKERKELEFRMKQAEDKNVEPESDYVHKSKQHDKYRHHNRSRRESKKSKDDSRHLSPRRSKDRDHRREKRKKESVAHCQSPRSKKVPELHRDSPRKMKDSDLEGFVVCDSWSLDTDQKSESKDEKSHSKDRDSLKTELTIKKALETPLKQLDLSSKEDTLSIKSCETLDSLKFCDNFKSTFRNVEKEEEDADFSRDVTPKLVEEDVLTPQISKWSSPKRSSKDRSIRSNRSSLSSETLARSIDRVPTAVGTPVRSMERYVEPNDISIRSIDRSIRSNDTPVRSNDGSVRSNDTSVKSNDRSVSLNATSVRSNDTSVRSNDRSVTSIDRSVRSTEISRSPSFKSVESMTPTYENDFSIYREEELKPKYSKATELSLDIWNYVLKICQPLMFRHVQRNCYRETENEPPVYYAVSPRVCNCVPERKVYYEELQSTKMNIVDRIYSDDQITEVSLEAQTKWYPVTEKSLGQVTVIQLDTNWETDDSNDVPKVLAQKAEAPVVEQTKKAIIDVRDFPRLEEKNLDAEYEKFMEAVLDDATKKSDFEEMDSVWNEDLTPQNSDNEQDEDRKDRKKSKKKQSKTPTSEYWSQDSADEENSEKKLKKKTKDMDDVKKRKKEKHKKSSTSSSESDEKINKKSSSKKVVKKTKDKAKKRKLAEKRKLKKQKERKKLQKEKQKRQKSGDDKDVTKKKKLKKDELVKKKRKKQQRKESSSSSTSSSSSSSSSSDSESEVERRKKKYKKRLDRSKNGKALKKSKHQDSTSYSDNDEQFDMEVLNNIKMENVSDEDTGRRPSIAVEEPEFSPRRKSVPATTVSQEIISVSELHSDFNRSVKEEPNNLEPVSDVETKTNNEWETPTRIDEDMEQCRPHKRKAEHIFDENEHRPKERKTSPIPNENSETAHVQSLDEHRQPVEQEQIKPIMENSYPDADVMEYDYEERGFFHGYDEYVMSEGGYVGNESQSNDTNFTGEMEQHRIETIHGNRGEIKCDWRPGEQDSVKADKKPSRWGKGVQAKSGDANIVLTDPSRDSSMTYRIPTVLDGDAQEQIVYKIETISSSGRSFEDVGYDEAYADMYGESDQQQYGDCFSEHVSKDPRLAQKKHSISLDDRITQVLNNAALPAKEEEPSPTNEKGILISMNSSNAISFGVKIKRGKSVTFADGYKPGEDSENEAPKKRKKKRTDVVYGCAWPCPAWHPDHVPAWDALPPPPPPPGSPPPPASLVAPPAHTLRPYVPRRPPLLPNPPHIMAGFKSNTIQHQIPTITRLPN